MDELEDWIVVVRASSRVLGARLLMPDIKCLVSDRTICASCQEMPTWMEVAMDERVSEEEGLRLVQRLEPLHLAFSAPGRSM